MLDLRAKTLRRDLDDLECVESVNLRNRWTPHSNKLQLLAVVHAGVISKKEGATPCYRTGAQTIDQIVISALNSELGPMRCNTVRWRVALFRKP